MGRSTVKALLGGVLLPAALATGAPGCGPSSSDPPVIFDINRATAPASRAGVLIEISGTDFRSLPGRVVFSQGGNVAEVVPPVDDWGLERIAVKVPAAGSGGGFTAPGTLAVSVVTLIEESNGVDLALEPSPGFSLEDVQWAATSPLPAALRGLRAAPVPGTATQAHAIVTGGNDGSANVTTVLVATLDQDGQVGAWTTSTPLPAPRAHHGMAAAHAGNSPVPAMSAFVYVVGGQESQGNTPGGTTTVFLAPVDTALGAVGDWTSATPLPEALVGPAVAVHHGYLHVVGGLRPDGTPTSAVRSAALSESGAPGAWKLSLDPYPTPIAFAATFTDGLDLYILGGDTVGAIDPNAQGSPGVAAARRSRIEEGEAGPWTSVSSLVRRRQKHAAWAASGQVLAAGGVHDAAPGSSELERSAVQSGGSLSSWSEVAGAGSQIGAHVCNAAALVSPIRPAGSGPRFLLLGGQSFSATPPGALSSAVFRNTAP